MTTKEIIKTINDEGFMLSSSFKNNKYTVNIDRNGVRYVRTGADFDQCVKSLKFDIK